MGEEVLSSVGYFVEVVNDCFPFLWVVSEIFRYRAIAHLAAWTLHKEESVKTAVFTLNDGLEVPLKGLVLDGAVQAIGGFFWFYEKLVVSLAVGCFHLSVVERETHLHVRTSCFRIFSEVGEHACQLVMELKDTCLRRHKELFQPLGRNVLCHIYRR